MATDKYGNSVIRKDFWADGVWQAVFLLIPIFIGALLFEVILAYGAYAAFQREPEHIRVLILFFTFSLVGAASLVFLGRNIWALLNEKITLTSDRLSYTGFGSFSIPYSSIKRVTISEHAGILDKERRLFFVAGDGVTKDKMYAIPRWRSLAGGVLARELSSRMTLSILDHNALSFYTPKGGKERFLPYLLLTAGVFFIISFLAVRGSSGAIVGVIIFIWFLLASAFIFTLWRYLRIKKNVILS